jgi:hypothetical protein
MARRFTYLLAVLALGMSLSQVSAQSSVQVIVSGVPPVLQTASIEDFATAARQGMMPVTTIHGSPGGSSLDVRLTLGLRHNGTLLLEETSEVFALQSGVETYPSIGSPDSPIRFSRTLSEIVEGLSDDAARAFDSGLFLEGDYVIETQISAESPDVFLTSVPTETRFSVSYSRPPDLQEPFDGESLDAAWPIFRWQPPLTGAVDVQLAYEFVLAEVMEDQQPIDALDANFLHAARSGLREPFLVYSPEFLPLQPGRTYVWQVGVSDLNGRTSFTQDGVTDPWTFTYTVGQTFATDEPLEWIYPSWQEIFRFPIDSYELTDFAVEADGELLGATVQSEPTAARLDSLELSNPDLRFETGRVFVDRGFRVELGFQPNSGAFIHASVPDGDEAPSESGRIRFRLPAGTLESGGYAPANTSVLAKVSIRGLPEELSAEFEGVVFTLDSGLALGAGRIALVGADGPLGTIDSRGLTLNETVPESTLPPRLTLGYPGQGALELTGPVLSDLFVSGPDARGVYTASTRPGTTVSLSLGLLGDPLSLPATLSDIRFGAGGRVSGGVAEVEVIEAAERFVQATGISPNTVTFSEDHWVLSGAPVVDGFETLPVSLAFDGTGILEYPLTGSAEVSPDWLRFPGPMTAAEFVLSGSRRGGLGSDVLDETISFAGDLSVDDLSLGPIEFVRRRSAGVSELQLIGLPIETLESPARLAGNASSSFSLASIQGARVVAPTEGGVDVEFDVRGRYQWQVEGRALSLGGVAATLGAGALQIEGAERGLERVLQTDLWTMSITALTANATSVRWDESDHEFGAELQATLRAAAGTPFSELSRDADVLLELGVLLGGSIRGPIRSVDISGAWNAGAVALSGRRLSGSVESPQVRAAVYWISDGATSVMEGCQAPSVEFSLDKSGRPIGQAALSQLCESLPVGPLDVQFSNAELSLGDGVLSGTVTVLQSGSAVVSSGSLIFGTEPGPTGSVDISGSYGWGWPEASPVYQFLVDGGTLGENGLRLGDRGLFEDTATVFDGVTLAWGSRDAGVGEFRIGAGHNLAFQPREERWVAGLSAGDGVSIQLSADEKVQLQGVLVEQAVQGSLRYDGLDVTGLNVEIDSALDIRFAGEPVASGSVVWRSGSEPVARLGTDGFRLLGSAAESASLSRLVLTSGVSVALREADGSAVVSVQATDRGYVLSAEGTKLVATFHSLVSDDGPLEVPVALDGVVADDGGVLVEGTVTFDPIDFSSFGFPLEVSGFRYSASEGFSGTGRPVLPGSLAGLRGEGWPVSFDRRGRPFVDRRHDRGEPYAETEWDDGSVTLALTRYSAIPDSVATVRFVLKTGMFLEEGGQRHPVRLDASYLGGSWQFEDVEARSLPVGTLSLDVRDAVAIATEDRFALEMGAALSLPAGFDRTSVLSFEMARFGSSGIELTPYESSRLTIAGAILELDTGDLSPEFSDGAAAIRLGSVRSRIYGTERSLEQGLVLRSDGSSNLQDLDFLAGEAVQLLENTALLETLRVHPDSSVLVTTTGQLTLPGPMSGKILALRLNVDSGGTVSLDKTMWPELDADGILGNREEAEFEIPGGDAFFELDRLDLVTDLRSRRRTELHGWGAAYLLAGGGTPGVGGAIDAGRQLQFGDGNRPGFTITNARTRWHLTSSAPAFSYPVLSALGLAADISSARLVGSRDEFRVDLSGGISFDRLAPLVSGSVLWDGMVLRADGFSTGGIAESFTLSAAMGKVVLEVGTVIKESAPADDPLRISVVREKPGSTLGSVNPAAAAIESEEPLYPAEDADIGQEFVEVTDVLMFAGPTGGAGAKATVADILSAEIGQFLLYKTVGGETGFAIRDVAMSASALPISIVADMEYAPAGGFDRDWALRIAGQFTFERDPAKKPKQGWTPASRSEGTQRSQTVSIGGQRNASSGWVSARPSDSATRSPTVAIGGQRQQKAQEFGGAIAGKIGQYRGKASFGMFGAYWAPTPLLALPGALDLLGGGLGFYYNPDPVDIAEALRVSRASLARSQPEAADLDFAILAFGDIGGMKAGQDYLLKASGFLQITGAYSKLDVTGDYAVEKPAALERISGFEKVPKRMVMAKGYFYLQAYYPNGLDDSVWEGAAAVATTGLGRLMSFGAAAEVELAFFLSFRNGDVNVWAISGRLADLDVLGFRMQGTFLASSSGFYTDMRLDAGFNFWVIDFRGGMSGAMWYYTPAQEFGAYGEVYVYARVKYLGVSMSATAKGGLIVGGDGYLLYLAARARVKVLLAKFTVRLWISLENGSWDGGFGRSESKERAIARSMARLTELQTLAQDLQDSMGEALLAQYQVSDEVLQARGIALLESDPFERRSFALEAIDNEFTFGRNASRREMIARANNLIIGQDRPASRKSQVEHYAGWAHAAITKSESNRAELLAVLSDADLLLSDSDKFQEEAFEEFRSPVTSVGAYPHGEFEIDGGAQSEQAAQVSAERREDAAYREALRATIEESVTLETELRDLVAGEDGLGDYANAYRDALESVQAHRAVTMADAWEQLDWARSASNNLLGQVDYECGRVANDSDIKLLAMECRWVDRFLEEEHRAMLSQGPIWSIWRIWGLRPDYGREVAEEMARNGLDAVAPIFYVSLSGPIQQMESRLRIGGQLLDDTDTSMLDNYRTTVMRGLSSPSVLDVINRRNQGRRNTVLTDRLERPTPAWEHVLGLGTQWVNLSRFERQYVENGAEIWSGMLVLGLQAFKDQRVDSLNAIAEATEDLDRLEIDRQRLDSTLVASLSALGSLAAGRQELVDEYSASPEDCLDEFCELPQPDAGLIPVGMQVAATPIGEHLVAFDVEVSVNAPDQDLWSATIEFEVGGEQVGASTIALSDRRLSSQSLPGLPAFTPQEYPPSPNAELLVEAATTPSPIPGETGVVRFWLPRLSLDATTTTATVRLRLHGVGGTSPEVESVLPVEWTGIPEDRVVRRGQ